MNKQARAPLAAACRPNRQVRNVLNVVKNSGSG
jgi:hypothetical protein